MTLLKPVIQDELATKAYLQTIHDDLLRKIYRSSHPLPDNAVTIFDLYDAIDSATTKLVSDPQLANYAKDDDLLQTIDFSLEKMSAGDATTIGLLVKRVDGLPVLETKTIWLDAGLLILPSSQEVDTHLFIVRHRNDAFLLPYTVLFQQ